MKFKNMKFNKKTIISIVITICLLLLITFLVKFCEYEYKKCQKCNKEGLQYYGSETDGVDAPLPYKTVMENIKYPVSNQETGETPIYDTTDELYNSLLFNKANKQIHFSDEQIMKDLKYFNNSTNLLLEHYFNNNVPDNVSINIQDMSGTILSSSILSESDISNVDYYTTINFKTETMDKTPPSYLYNYANERPIEKEKTYIYRLSMDNGRLKGKKHRKRGDSGGGGRGLFSRMDRARDKYNPRSGKSPTNGMYMVKEVTRVNDELHKDNIYNYDYDISGMKYDDVYDELTNYDKSIFNKEVSMIKPGKYSSHYFESNYADLSDNVTKDFKYFYSTAPTIGGSGLFNKS